MSFFDVFWNELPFVAFGALLVIVFHVIVRLGEEFLGDRNSYERRWSRHHRAMRRERARLAKKGTP